MEKGVVLLEKPVLENLIYGAELVTTGKYIGMDYTVFDNGVCVLTGNMKGERQESDVIPLDGVTIVYSDFVPVHICVYLFYKFQNVERFYFSDRTARAFKDTESFAYALERYKKTKNYNVKK